MICSNLEGFVFQNALMTCEEDSLEKATAILKDVESRCAQNLGWLRAMKNKVFGRNVCYLS